MNKTGGSMKTAKFDYMFFSGGSDGDEFVAHANKYTKRQVIDLFVDEANFEYVVTHRTPDLKDVELRYVKFFVKVPATCGVDDDGYGCYSFCEQGARGSFPALVITVKDLKL
jgi:hypothetical protein